MNAGSLTCGLQTPRGVYYQASEAMRFEEAAKFRDSISNLKKLSENSTEIRDSIRQGHIAYVINTSAVGAPRETSDGYQIRRFAIESNVTMFTSLDTVKVLLDVLDETTLRISTIDA